MNKQQIINYLCEKVEMCQSKGCYTIKDAYVLKDCIDFLQKGEATSKEINEDNSVDGIMQALNIGQSKGVFTLEDAHNIYEYTEKLLALKVSPETQEPHDEESKITEI
jgi:hypothetical protein